MVNSEFIGNINFRSGNCMFQAKAFQINDENVQMFVIEYDNDVTYRIMRKGKFWIQVTRTQNGEYFAEKAGKEIEKIFSSKGLSIIN
jgi:hypothetical protein